MNETIVFILIAVVTISSSLLSNTTLTAHAVVICVDVLIRVLFSTG
jgi:hypothetical protein